MVPFFFLLKCAVTYEWLDLKWFRELQRKRCVEIKKSLFINFAKRDICYMDY